MTVRAPVPLRSFWYTRRKPSLVVDDDWLEIRLPVYFGRVVWRVPVGDVAVTKVADITATDVALDGDAIFAHGVSLPYFFTTGPASSPNLLIQFRQPERVPPLCWIAASAPNVALPFTRRETRSPVGATVDGMLLRAVDPNLAVRDLHSAGIEVTLDPAAWLAAHRELLSDPIERQQLIDREKRAESLFRASTWIGGVALVAVAVVGGDAHLPLWTDAFPVLVLGSAGALRWHARRIMRNQDASGDGRPRLPTPENAKTLNP